jgi:putative integral membrane protein (TIGR02587 family)
MTMEMWEIGFYADRIRLLVFLGVSVPLLIGLSYYSGIEDSFDWREEVLDASTAFGVGAVTSVLLLLLFGVVDAQTNWHDAVGDVAIQAVPASIGAMLARKQFGSDTAEQERKKKEASYFGSLFLMAVGALYVAFNVAPTEEMVLIAYKMAPWQGLMLMAVSILVLHALVYTIGFYGQEEQAQDGAVGTFLRFSVVGYAVALLVSLFVLWVFHRTDGHSLMQIVEVAVVLGFPAALGAATARLIL